MKRRKYTAEQLPAVGSVFLVPLADGRYGAVRVLQHNTERPKDVNVYAVASTWIGASATRPDDAELRPSLSLTHHAWKGMPQALWIAEPPPASFLPVAPLAPSLEDEAIVSNAYSGWENFPFHILLQWRWDHDREALLAEEAAQAAQEVEERRQRNERHEEMLRTLTLENVATRTWFESWDEELDGPYLAAARAILADFIRDLTAAPKLTSSVVRKRLQATVQQFNQLDTEHQFIETTHREDICDALEMILCAARHPDLSTSIDGWRDW